ncbi:MAG: amidohydrolase family protein, partial [Cyanobacteria bacterium]|nr:amidohydrolase family protein [Cyanobacteriota bacterium]
YPPPLDIAKNTLINRRVIHELGEIFGLSSNTSQDKIAEYRNKVYKADPKAYIQKLIGPIKIEKIIIESGFPSEYYSGYEVNLNYFAELFSTEVYSAYRMDIEINKILEDLPSTFDEAIQIVDEDFINAIKKRKTVAIKTTIAYQTGLDIRKTSKGEAFSAFKRIKKNANMEDEKIIRDYFFMVFIKKCKELDIPMQIHTGYGSPPVLNLFKANPMLLQFILAEEDLKEIRVILVHAGYPFLKEAGFMTSVYQNCYADLSIVPYFGIGYKKALLDILECAPVSRIIFGSDGANIPETYWFAYTHGPKILDEVLNELSQTGWINKKEVLEFTEMILNKNAKKIFRV